jgi:hypothetical protein
LRPATIIELGRQWYAMPHRWGLRAFLNGGVIQTMMGDDEHGCCRVSVATAADIDFRA